MKKALWLGVVLAALAAPSFAGEDAVVRILTVRNRPAESIVPTLQPLAGPDGVVTASANRLVVRAAPAALAQIERVLAELDVPPRALWISVRQDLDSATSASGAGVSASVGAGDGHSRTVVAGVFAGGTSQRSDSGIQRLQALEGARAFIHVGRAVPVTQTAVVPSAGGLAVVPASGYQEAATGFHVVPRLSGSLVTLEILAGDEGIDDRGAVRGQRIGTTVSGRLGEWLRVGGGSRSREEHRSAALGGGTTKSAEESAVYLKVEEAR